MNGKFIISLDYELMWGVRDKKTVNTYGQNIANVPIVIDLLLAIFSKFEINATFATVGVLFANNKVEINRFSPPVKPIYNIKNLSPYNDYIGGIGDDFSDVYNYAYNSLIKIKECSNHEISTHTFSHFYCLEEGQNKEAFSSDLKSAIEIAEKEGVNFKTIVFPRNQHNVEYNDILIKNGIKGYRGNEKAWYYNPKKGEDDTYIRRIFRLLDSYINISGHNSYAIMDGSHDELINIPSSRFLRPYSSIFKPFEALRLQRIKKSMTYAAKSGQIYHLWWHPHNFGAHQKENFAFLEKILKHYKELNTKYNFKSYTMKSAAKL